VAVYIVLTVSTENVTITSTISSEQPVCPEDRLNFTCETRGSDFIAWISKEYLNSDGSRVEFTFVDKGEIREINRNTVTTLVSADSINGIRVLISRLTIVVSPMYRNPSITCLHVGRLINDTVSFVVPGNNYCNFYYNQNLSGNSYCNFYLLYYLLAPNYFKHADISVIHLHSNLYHHRLCLITTE
jgi:hypothetical protein